MIFAILFFPNLLKFEENDHISFEFFLRATIKLSKKKSKSEVHDHKWLGLSIEKLRQMVTLGSLKTRASNKYDNSKNAQNLKKFPFLIQ